MISFQEASKLVLDNVEVLGSEKCLIESLIDRRLYEDVVSGIDVVSFRNSAMDGFAVRAEWLEACSDGSSLKFSYRDTIFAGDELKVEYSDNRPVKVMTGAPVPDGYDTVVQFEDTSYDESSVEFRKSVVVGAHVRNPGEDIQIGQKLFVAGHLVRSLDAGIIASVGLAEVPVYRLPKVLVATTGNELIQQGKTLRAGQIYNSNLHSISALVSRVCGQVDRVLDVADTHKSLAAVLEQSHDVIITSGGVSAGERDLVVKTAESLGWRTIFHKIKIKPGKPVYFARRGKQVLFGLPGNPLSSAVTCSIFVLPALKKMTGYCEYELHPKPAYLKPDSIRKCKRLLIWPGTFVIVDDRTQVEFSDKKSSAALTALMESDGLIFQSETDGGDSKGVAVRALPWGDILPKGW